MNYLLYIPITNPGKITKKQMNKIKKSLRKIKEAENKERDKLAYDLLNNAYTPNYIK